MKQFDLYENVDPDSRETYPYFVDVQTDLLNDLNSRVLIPIAVVQDAKSFQKSLPGSRNLETKNMLFSLTKLQLSQFHFWLAKKALCCLTDRILSLRSIFC